MRHVVQNFVHNFEVCGKLLNLAKLGTFVLIRMESGDKEP